MMKMISIKDRKIISKMKKEIDSKLSSFSLKIKRLENDNLMLKTRFNVLENLIKEGEK